MTKLCDHYLPPYLPPSRVAARNRLSAITPVIAVHGNDETAAAQQELPYQQLIVVAGQRILLPRADIAREALAIGLREQGARVDEIAAYRTVPGDGAPELVALLRARVIDAITFTSSSTVRYLLGGLAAAGLERAEARALFQHAAVVCIGPITAATAREEGLRVDAIAREYTGEGLVAALADWFRQAAIAG